MPHEPLAPLDLLVGLPDEADFETVYAVVMATERGRRFLADYAARNRNADTNMLVGAIERVEAAIRGEPSAQSSAGLKEIAVAIERIDAVLAAVKASNIHSAVERIQDIAFVLHERPVEQSLCDALDGAIREISDALSSPDGPAETLRKTAELLHALGGRVNAMITPSTEPASTFAAGANDQESFAGAIAALATLLPSLADAAQPEAVTASESQADTEGPRDLHLIEAELPDAASTETVVMPHDGAGEASEAVQIAPPSSENVLLHAFESNPFSRDQTSSQIPAAYGEPKEEERTHEGQNHYGTGDVAPSEDTLPMHGLAREVVVNPEEDPADLFEPMPVPAPLPAPAAAAAVEAPPQSPSQCSAATPASRAMSRPPASDPLAAVRALSAEELIALFS
jgi:hypothetical protein